MIFLWLNHLMIVLKVIVYIGYPLTLLVHYFLSSASIDHFPFVIELVDSTEFSGYRGNTQSTCGPVILVTADGDTHHLFAGSRDSSFRELGMGYNVFENWEDSWTALIQIIWFHSVEWVDEGISVRMNVYHKIELLFMRG